jgi:hypothetical protein
MSKANNRMEFPGWSIDVDQFSFTVHKSGWSGKYSCMGDNAIDVLKPIIKKSIGDYQIFIEDLNSMLSLGNIIQIEGDPAPINDLAEEIGIKGGIRHVKNAYRLFARFMIILAILVTACLLAAHYFTNGAATTSMEDVVKGYKLSSYSSDMSLYDTLYRFDPNGEWEFSESTLYGLKKAGSCDVTWEGEIDIVSASDGSYTTSPFIIGFSIENLSKNYTQINADSITMNFAGITFSANNALDLAVIDGIFRTIYGGGDYTYTDSGDTYFFAAPGTTTYSPDYPDDETSDVSEVYDESMAAFESLIKYGESYVSDDGNGFVFYPVYPNGSDGEYQFHYIRGNGGAVENYDAYGYIWNSGAEWIEFQCDTEQMSLTFLNENGQYSLIVDDEGGTGAENASGTYTYAP